MDWHTLKDPTDLEPLAFEAFKENGILDHATGMKFREVILARGGTEDPMVLY